LIADHRLLSLNWRLELVSSQPLRVFSAARADEPGSGRVSGARTIRVAALAARFARQRGAVTRSASQARRHELVRTRRIELLSPEWRSGIEPINYIRLGCPGATRTRDPRSRKAVLCSTELRDRIESHIGPSSPSASTGTRSRRSCPPKRQRRRVVRPGGLEPPTALQSGAHDGYKPSALPIELWAQTEMVRVVGFEPTASCVRAGTLAGLSYTLLALRREIESLSPDRQSGRLTRCVTEREYGAPFFAEASKGILPRARLRANALRRAPALCRTCPPKLKRRRVVRLGRLERPLNALSTHSLCRLGYRRAIR
jgi:hypothetical protein